MLLRELLVRPAWQGQRMGKRMSLSRQKPNWPERERHTQRCGNDNSIVDSVLANTSYLAIHFHL